MNSSKITSVLFILLNVIAFTCVSSNKVPCPPKTMTPSGSAKCPKDTLKFGVCGDWLGLVHEVIGAQPDSECCTLIKGLADLEAALCLCTAIKANVFGLLKVKVPIALSLVLNSCGKKVPKGFKCT
ncbi:putative lipid-binding protein At4g00165 [Cynara cardunculus var. scolymus]|uniref:Bifunctional inhibitor/plant lipid transfer protein/seed storage helical domain-containing protein n=1 Tax=Cynara cardunculus var. scolymus TaxID=59895 RepID=A0A103XUE1_CYNCS|nr:putative lipid-binding protein At4g00165 [Cynara cardunculus var. scolymus]KVH97100.1 Bifunctional inhibitor/plant lipid transfer protein/seed storage helical domain-containing protein [Cynara cardunculus var. scolymus]